MRYSRRFVRRALAALAATVVAVIVAGGSTAHAQRYQNTHGGAFFPGETGEAVIEAANGDHIAAGVSYSISGGVNPHLYIVRVDAFGAYVWDNVYKISPWGPCHATDIKEYPSGELVVVGWIENPNCAGCRDGFVMRLKANGNLIWVRRLAGPFSVVELHAVTVCTIGNGINTFAGDIVVAGTVNNGVAGTADGYLARFDLNGKRVWEMTYDVLSPTGNSNDDVLNDVDETQIVSTSGTLGDIVAVGQSTDVTSGTPEDLWLLRVDGNTGVIGAAPQGSAVYGSASADAGTSIRELRNGANPGALAITGWSDGAPAPSTSREIIVLEVPDDPCSPVAPIATTFFGDNGALVDAGFAIREITSPNVGTPGDLMVTGGTWNSFFGGEDAFLQGFQEGALAPNTAFTVYGDVVDEEAHSLHEVTNAPNSQGWVFTGVTTSPALMPAGNQQNLYLVKTDKNLDSYCQFAPGTAFGSPTGWLPTCVKTKIFKQSLLFQEKAGWGSPGWIFTICAWATRIGPGTNGGNDGIASVDLADNASIFTSYPNPVAHDGTFNLRYILNKGGMVDVQIADMTGRVVYHHAEERGSGMTSELVSAAGWPAGTYAVKMTAGGAMRTTRIVVSGE